MERDKTLSHKCTSIVIQVYNGQSPHMFLHSQHLLYLYCISFHSFTLVFDSSPLIMMFTCPKPFTQLANNNSYLHVLIKN